MPNAQDRVDAIAALIREMWRALIATIGRLAHWARDSRARARPSRCRSRSRRPRPPHRCRAQRTPLAFMGEDIGSVSSRKVTLLVRNVGMDGLLHEEQRCRASNAGTLQGKADSPTRPTGPEPLIPELPAARQYLCDGRGIGRVTTQRHGNSSTLSNSPASP